MAGGRPPSRASFSTKQLETCGQSPWLDYLRRSLIEKGELRHLIERNGLKGVTSGSADVITAALFTRFHTRQEHTFGEKMNFFSVYVRQSHPHLRVRKAELPSYSCWRVSLANGCSGAPELPRRVQIQGSDAGRNVEANLPLH